MFQKNVRSRSGAEKNLKWWGSKTIKKKKKKKKNSDLKKGLGGGTFIW